MKKGDLNRLKALVLKHKGMFDISDEGKRVIHEQLKKQLVERVDLIQEMEGKIIKYLRDLEEYVVLLEKKCGVSLLAEEIDPMDTEITKDITAEETNITNIPESIPSSPEPEGTGFPEKKDDTGTIVPGSKIL